MKFTQGETRIVFVFPTIVIKIPRVRLPLIVFRVVKRLFRKELAVRLKQIEKPVQMVVFTYVTAGWHANREEYRYFKDHPNSKAIMPVRLFAFGLIEVQKRGVVLSEEDHVWDKLLQILKTNNIEKKSDLLKARNFCLSDDRICVLDYGNPNTIAALNDGGLELLEAY